MKEQEFSGFPSIDRPSSRFYPSDVDYIIQDGVDKKMYDFTKEKNVGYENDISYVYFDEPTKFSEFDIQINKCASALKSYGLDSGDSITICLPNIPETIIYFYACNLIGVTPYLVDPRSSEKRIIECMKNSNSKLLIALLDIMNKTIKPKNTPTDSIVVVSPASNFLNSVKSNKDAQKVKSFYEIKEKFYRMQELILRNKNVIMQNGFVKLSESYGTVTPSEYNPEIPAVIVNTSGTSGTPKGAMQSNMAYNIMANQIDYVAANLDRGSKYLGYIPFFSLYGSSVGMHAATSHGIIIDIMPKINPAKFDEIFLEHRPNIAISVPRLYNMFPTSNLIRGSDLSFAKLLVMGGDKESPSALEKVNRTLEENGSDIKITYGYGATEVMMISSTIKDDRSYVLGSCGTLYPGVNVRITDRETLEELPYGESGEIYVDSPTMFMGYVNNPSETENSIFVDQKTGVKYYKTADKGYMTRDGILFHEGRYKRLMKRPDGHQVNSVPIEDEINKSPLVKDCAVVGIRNLYQEEGEIPTAFIEFKDKSHGRKEIVEIIEQVKETLPGEREMALAYVIVDHIPYTINGKIDFQTLEKLKFEDVEFFIIDDPIFDDYFTHSEDLDKINLHGKRILKRTGK